MSDSLLGPKYDYTNELKAPREIGVKTGSSFDDITNALAGFNYYIDAIGFGESTGMAKANGLKNQPLGARYFMPTGATCSNGALMYEYIDNIPKGLPGRAGKEIQQTLGVGFRGLAPGIVEDAASALNPVRLFKAAIDSPYARCKKVVLPVGDFNGKLKSDYDNTVWVQGPVEMVSGKPHQTRWVFDTSVSQEEFDRTPKTEAAKKEGFLGNLGDPSIQTIAAGVLLAGLAVGVALHLKK